MLTARSLERAFAAGRTASFNGRRLELERFGAAASDLTRSLRGVGTSVSVAVRGTTRAALRCPLAAPHGAPNAVRSGVSPTEVRAPPRPSDGGGRAATPLPAHPAAAVHARKPASHPASQPRDPLQGLLQARARQQVRALALVGARARVLSCE